MLSKKIHLEQALSQLEIRKIPSSESELKSIYRKLAKKYHPDLTTDLLKKTYYSSKFIDVSDAYKFLSLQMAKKEIVEKEIKDVFEDRKPAADQTQKEKEDLLLYLRKYVVNYYKNNLFILLLMLPAAVYSFACYVLLMFVLFPFGIIELVLLFVGRFWRPARAAENKLRRILSLIEEHDKAISFAMGAVSAPFVIAKMAYDDLKSKTGINVIGTIFLITGSILLIVSVTSAIYNYINQRERLRKYVYGR